MHGKYAVLCATEAQLTCLAVDAVPNGSQPLLDMYMLQEVTQLTTSAATPETNFPTMRVPGSN